MTKNELISALKDLGKRPNKGLGQNFLIDKNILAKIVKAAEIKKGDRILEIGPGLGVLTQALTSAGASVTWIEKDKLLAERLLSQPSSPRHDLPAQAPLSKGDIQRKVLDRGIHADASKLNYSDIMSKKPWKFISNLPYAITSIALRKALYTENPPTLLVALIQKEVADRIMEPVRGSKTSLLGLMSHLACSKIEIISKVSKNSFYPPPKVESAIIKMQVMSNKERTKKWGANPEQIMKVAKQGFAHPRKLLQKNLGIANDEWQAICKKLNLNPKTRAEDLSVSQWASVGTLNSFARGECAFGAEL